MIWGTGKPLWERITDDDLTHTINNLNAINPKYVFLSAHDTCDYAIDRFKNELNSETTVLRAGATYQLCGLMITESGTRLAPKKN